MKSPFYFISTILFWLFSAPLYSQSTAAVDTVLIDSLLVLMQETNRSNPDQAKEYGQRALNLVGSADDLRKTKVLYLLSVPYALGDDKAKSIQLAEEGLKLARKNDFKSEEVDLLYALAISNFHYGNYTRSIALFHQALPICDQINDDVRKAKALNGISIAYIENNEMDQAIPYINQVYEIGVQLNNNQLKSIAKGNLSYAHIYKKEYNKALSHINEYFEISEVINDSINTVVGYDMLAQIRNGLGQYNEALLASDECLNRAQALGYKDGEVLGYKTKAVIYNNLKQYNRALNSATKGLEVTQEISAKRFTKDLYTSMIESQMNLGNYQQAVQLQKELSDVKENQFNLEKQKIRESLEIEYQVKKKDELNQILLTNQVRDEAIIYQRTLLSVGAFLLTFFIIGFTYYLNKSLQQKKKHNENLETAIKERTVDLVKSNSALKNSNHELERFAFVASHDLKEPIRNIVAYSTLMQRSIDNNELDDITELSNSVIGNSKNLYALIDGILNFSRIRKIKIDLKDHNIIDIINEAQTLIANKIEEEKVEISIEIDHPTTHCDEKQTLLVIKNLIENAIKYNTSTPKTLRIYQSHSDLYQNIHFTDNGIGIDPKYQEQIFEMFQRLHSKSAYEGTGLGLSICKRIMNMHQGEISVKSQSSEGSTFTISFPIRKEYLS